MSYIVGNGYGSSHDWVGNTPQDNLKRTFYICCVCGEMFTHFYDRMPDIFKCIEESNVPDQCAGLESRVYG